MWHFLESAQKWSITSGLSFCSRHHLTTSFRHQLRRTIHRGYLPGFMAAASETPLFPRHLKDGVGTHQDESGTPRRRVSSVRNPLHPLLHGSAQVHAVRTSQVSEK